MTTRDELLARINAYTQPVYGIDVTPRMLRDWVSERLVPGPTVSESQGGYRAGVARSWSSVAYRRVLQICRLKHQGIARRSAVITALWLSGVDYPFEIVQPAILEEYQRARQRIHRGLPVDWDPRSETGSIQGIASTMTAHLVSGADDRQSERAAAARHALAAMVFGVDLLPTAEEWYGPTGPLSVLTGIPLPDDQSGILAEEAPVGIAMVLGLLGDPEEIENSAEDRIRRADAETFTDLREWILAYPYALALTREMIRFLPPEFGAFESVFVSPTGDPRSPLERLATFVSFLARSEIKKHRGRPYALGATLLAASRRMLRSVKTDPDVRQLLRESIGDACDAETEDDALMLLLRWSQRASQGPRIAVIRALWRSGFAEYVAVCRAIRREMAAIDS